MRIAVTCKHLQRDLDQGYRERIERAGFAIVVPEIEGQELAGEALVSAMSTVGGVIAGDDKFTAEVLGRLPDLRAIAKWGIGLDGIDQQAAETLGISVTNTPGMFNDEVAEMALGYTISLIRGIVSTDRAVRRGEWRNPVGRSLTQKRVTLLGLGNIGLSFAQKAQALGMDVRAVDPGERARADAASIGVILGELTDLLPETDVLVVTCPLNSGTHGLINSATLAQMPVGAWLVNVGRGPVAVDADIASALRSGHLGGAALDVFEVEPLPEDSELRSFDNVILGTHNSSNTLEACHRTHDASISNLLAQLEASS